MRSAKHTKLINKVLAIALSIMMVAGMLPVSSMSAAAAPEVPEETPHTEGIIITVKDSEETLIEDAEITYTITQTVIDETTNETTNETVKEETTKMTTENGQVELMTVEELKDYDAGVDLNVNGIVNKTGYGKVEINEKITTSEDESGNIVAGPLKDVVLLPEIPEGDIKFMPFDTCVKDVQDQVAAFMVLAQSGDTVEITLTTSPEKSTSQVTDTEDKKGKILNVSGLGQYTAKVSVSREGCAPWEKEFSFTVEQLNAVPVEVKINDNLTYNGESQTVVEVVPEKNSKINIDKCKISFDVKDEKDNPLTEGITTDKNKLSVTNAGSYKVAVKVTHDEYSDFNQTVEFTVNKGIPQISFENKNYKDGQTTTKAFDTNSSKNKFDFKLANEENVKALYGNVTYQLEETKNEPTDSSMATIDGSVVSVTGAPCELEISATVAGTDNYESHTITHNLIINQNDVQASKNLVIDTKPVDYIIGTSAHTIDKNIHSNNAVAYFKVSNYTGHDKEITVSVMNQDLKKYFDSTIKKINSDNERTYHIVTINLKDGCLDELAEKLDKAPDGVTVNIKASIPAKKGWFGNIKYEAAEKSTSFKITSLDIPETVKPSISGTLGENGFYVDDVTVTAPDGYLIAEDIDKGFKSSITVDYDLDEGDDMPSYYLKDNREVFEQEPAPDAAPDAPAPQPEPNPNYGGISSIIRLDTITIDKTVPTVDEAEYEVKDVEDNGPKKQSFKVKASDKHLITNSIFVTGKVTTLDGTVNQDAINKLTTLLKNNAWTTKDIQSSIEIAGELLVDGIYKNVQVQMNDAAGNVMTAKVADFVVDNTAPEAVTVTYSNPDFTTTVDLIKSILTLNFYKAPVTMTFTATDNASGVKEFKWSYVEENKEKAAEVLKKHEASDLTDVIVNAEKGEGNTYTATAVLPDDFKKDPKQYRGHIRVQAIDNYNNSSNYQKDETNELIIDPDAPEISVSFNEADNVVENTDTAYYKGDATADLTIKEANFYPEDVHVYKTLNGTKTALALEWTAVEEEADTYTAQAVFQEEGDYKLSVEYSDRSTNKAIYVSKGNSALESNSILESNYASETSSESYRSCDIVIDKTDPVVDVEYENKDVKNIIDNTEYYDAAQTAVITVTEHNFYSEGVDYEITATDVTGKEVDPSVYHEAEAWTHNGDVHTLTIEYPGDANYTFVVNEVKDLATRTAAPYETKYFTVDKTQPANLAVHYSDSVQDREDVGYYNSKMTVTLTAEDDTSKINGFNYSYKNALGVSSVNAELINQKIAAAQIEYPESGAGRVAQVTFEIPKEALTVNDQFNGTVGFKTADRSANETGLDDTKRIVVDNISPTSEISYNTPVNTEGDVTYYDGNIHASLTINEANFFAEDVAVTVTKDGASYPVSPSWSDSGVDVHTGTFTLTEDGDYFVSVSYTDRSTNAMAEYTSQQMTIDTVIETPVITINGNNESGHAYKEEVVPGVSFEDVNFNSHEITLTRTSYGNINEDVTAKFLAGGVALNGTGGSGSFDTFAKEADVDGIYTLTVSMNDKANHSSEAQTVFTVNRFGSVYEYSPYLATLIKDGGAYVQDMKEDLVITEYNADKLVGDSLKIEITKDGKPISNAEYKATPSLNSEAQIGESGWYQYEYTIAKSNFSSDGVYKVFVSSADETGNTPENTNYKDKDILFRVDSTVPEITSVTGLEEKIINAQEAPVNYTIFDNIGLKSVKVFVDDKQVGETVTDFADDLNNYEGAFAIADSSDKQNVRLVVEDLAGNVTDTDAEEFSSAYTFNKAVTVSTSAFVRWYANKPLFWGSIIGLVAIVGGAAVMILAKRKKDEDEAQK